MLSLLLLVMLLTREEEKQEQEVAEWLQEVALIPLEQLVGSRGLGDRGGVRQFLSCMAEYVEVRGKKRMLREVRGAESVAFMEGSLCMEQLGVSEVEGEWGEEGLEGRALVTLEDDTLREGWYRGGVLWGVVRGWRWDNANVGWLELKLESLVPHAGGRVEVGAPGWWLPVGGGALSCGTDLQGRASGARCGYLYPGLSTALVGSWLEGRMVSRVCQ